MIYPILSTDAMHLASTGKSVVDPGCNPDNWHMLNQQDIAELLITRSQDGFGAIEHEDRIELKRVACGPGFGPTLLA